jgi:SAM-dependent methyltransferase
VKQGLFHLIEGFYLAQIANRLQGDGVFESLGSGRSAKAVADELGYDEELLAALLEFVYQASDLLTRSRAGVYSLSPRYPGYAFLGFQLDKFLGAYGPAVLDLRRSLTSKDLGRRLVDREIQAAAYSRIQSPPNPIVMQLARELQLQSMLDLGCGPATLLTGLCRGNPSFRGWGIDESGPMCRAARQRIAEAGLGKRVRIVHGDARRAGSHFSASVRGQMDAVQCKGMFNELFRRGNSEAVAFLGRLKHWFPGTLLFVVDYHGKLTRLKTVPREYRHTLIHDVIQFLSAQGVPPADRKGWNRIYRAAGCLLQHSCEGDHQGIEWFVHVVRL